MAQYNRITPEGMRDLLFAQCDVRLAVENKITDLFAHLGYNRIMTPGVEYYDVFTGERSNFSQESMFKLVGSSGRLLVLRPDATLPISRIVATKLKSMPMPLRLYYSHDIFKINPAYSGRCNEFRQTGIEIIGAGGMKADLEVIDTAVLALSRCSDDYRIELGHVGFFQALTASLPINQQGRDDIRRFVESKNYAALGDILDSLPKSKAVTALRKLPSLFGSYEVFDKAAELFHDDTSAEILKYLKTIYDKLCAIGIEDRVIVDLGLINSNNYYTGVVFRGYIKGLGDAVLAGGRYDELISEFGAHLEATGFGIDVSAIARTVLADKSCVDTNIPEMLIHADNEYDIRALKYASKQVTGGKTVEISVFDNVSDAKKYAILKGIGKLCIVTENIETIDLSEGV